MTTGSESRAIFEAARVAEATVITKDSDFVLLQEQLGAPPKIVWVRRGNTSNARLREVFANVLPNAFGLLEGGTKKVRGIIPFRIDSRTVAVLAYERHFAGLSDNAVLADESWSWFGCDRQDAMSELQRWARRNLLLIQSGAELVKIDWLCKSMLEVIHGIR